MTKLLKLFHAVLDGMIQCLFRLATRDPLYSGYLTKATYSPWKQDEDFKRLFETTHRYTLVDRYRSYCLWMMVRQTAHLEGALLEVGVWRGGTGALIAKRAESCGITDKVYLCDTFSGVVKAGEQDTHYKGSEHADTDEEVVKGLLSDCGVQNAVILKGIFPEDTGDQISEEKIRFCHIDVDVYLSAQHILDWVWDRMPVGGIVVYDDYGFHDCDGIRKQVEEQLDMPDRTVIHNLTGQAIVIKTAMPSA